MNILLWLLVGLVAIFFVIIIIYIIFGLILTFMGFRGFSHHFMLYRTIQNTPTVKLVSAPQGFVEITGQVIESPAGLQVCPASNTKCAWWRYYKYELIHKDHKGNEDWQRVEEASSYHPIYVDDGTATCHIAPIEATMYITRTSKWEIAKQGKHYRYHEEFIFPAEKIYLLGSLETRNLTEQPKSPEDIISEWQLDPPEFYNRFDQNKDCHLASDEWQAIKSAAQLAATASQQDTIEHKIVKPLGKWPFIISTESETQLIRTVKLQALIAIFGTIIICLFIVYKLIS